MKGRCSTMSLNQYIVSIDDEKHNIHAITVIYAAERELARETVAENSASDTVIGVYDKFPVILIEDGTNYILYAWQLLRNILAVVKQKEKVLTLEEELKVERLELLECERILRETREEEEAIPQF